MNAAQQIHHALGIAVRADSGRQRQPTHTKAGPGRRHDANRAIKTMKQRQAGAYGRGLRNWINRKQAVAQSIKLSRRMAAQATA